MSEDPDHGQPRRSLHTFFLLVLGFGAAAGLIALIASSSGFTFEDGDLPRLIGLVAILAFLAVGIIGRQMRAWHVIRSLLAWALIIFVVTGLYASRDQLAGVAGRLVGALAPGIPVSGLLAGEDNPESVVITRSGDGHFGVRTSVDDIPVTMLIDTGASFVTLSHGDAARVGINPDTLDYSVPIRTANGTMQAARITLHSLAIGSIEQRNVRALVAPAGSLSQSLLGMSFLDLLHGYAISGDRLVLTP